MNSKVHSNFDEQPATLVAQLHQHDEAAQQDEAVKKIAFRLVAYQGVIGAAVVAVIALVPIAHLALDRSRQNPIAPQDTFLALGYMVILLWPVIVVVGLICLDFEFRMLCWGAYWRGLGWAKIVGTSITVIVAINFGLCASCVARLLWKLADKL